MHLCVCTTAIWEHVFLTTTINFWGLTRSLDDLLDFRGDFLHEQMKKQIGGKITTFWEQGFILGEYQHSGAILFITSPAGLCSQGSHTLCREYMMSSMRAC